MLISCLPLELEKPGIEKCKTEELRASSALLMILALEGEDFQKQKQDLISVYAFKIEGIAVFSQGIEGYDRNSFLFFFSASVGRQICFKASQRLKEDCRKQSGFSVL